jgi:long-chain acyl-CoA synthetase
MSATLPALVLERAEREGDALAVRQKARGIWRRFTWAQIWNDAEILAAGLLAEHGNPPPRVAVISSDTVDALVAGIAVQSLGGAVVYLSPDATAAEVGAALAEAAVTCVVAQDQEQCDKVIDARGGFELDRVFYLDPRGLAEYADPRLRPITAVREVGFSALARDAQVVRTLMSKVDPTTVASVVLTAGGRAVPLSHADLLDAGRRLASVSELKAGANYFVTTQLTRPMSQYLAFGVALAVGLVTNFPEWPSTVAGDRREVAPHVLALTARDWQATFDDMEAAIRTSSRSARAIYRWARPDTTSGRRKSAPARMVFPLVRRSLRRRLGLVRLTAAFSSGAPLGSRAEAFFRALGVRVHDVYTFAEVGPLAVDGRLLAGAPTVRVDDDEIQAAAGAEWVHSGDSGQLDGDSLRVGDRLADRLPDGRWPRDIEDPLRESPYIRTAVIAPDDDGLIALIGINQPAVVEWLKVSEVDDRSLPALVGNPRVRQLIEREVGQRAGAEIGRVVLITRTLDSGAGELTPDGRVRRDRTTAGATAAPERVKERTP